MDVRKKFTIITKAFEQSKNRDPENNAPMTVKVSKQTARALVPRLVKLSMSGMQFAAIDIAPPVPENGETDWLKSLEETCHSQWKPSTPQMQLVSFGIKP